MSSNGYISSSTTNKNAKLGDIVQLYNSSAGTFTHSVILTGKNSSGWLYCGHSSNRRDYPLANVYPGSNYTKIRYMKFW